MFLRVPVCLGCILWTALVNLPAAAQQQPASDWTRCVNEGTAFSLDLQIRACTAVLQSPRETPRNRFIAQHNRLIAHRLKRDCDRAIADYSEAIRRDRNSASAYSGRAQVYLKAGKAAAGLPDVQRALRRCSGYMAVMARFKTQEELKAYRADILSERVGTINERRAMLGSGKCP